MYMYIHIVWKLTLSVGGETKSLHLWFFFFFFLLYFENYRKYFDLFPVFINYTCWF